MLFIEISNLFRSPPITLLNSGPNLSTQQQQFGTLKAPFTQSHEAINAGIRAAQPAPIGKLNGIKAIQ